MYYRRPPRRRPHHYMMPFIVIILIFGAVAFGWSALSSRLGSGSSVEALNTCVGLEIVSGGAMAMTPTGNEWRSVPNNIKLCQDEQVQTSVDGRSKLNFFEGSVLSLERESEVLLKTLAQRNFSNTIEVSLEKGAVWATINRSNSPDSSFSIQTDLLKIRSRNAVVSVEAPGSVYVIEGSAQVEAINSKGKVVKEYNVGVGQQLIVDESNLVSLSDGQDVQVLYALSDRFKDSGWYRFNTQGDNSDLTDLSALTTEQEAETETNPATTSTETTTSTTEKPQTAEEDKTPPAVPTISEPGKNDETVEINDIIQSISGQVSADTAAVIVNDYRLSKFQAGDRTFNYVANVAFSNLKVGLNEYKVIAEDKAGNQSKPAIITLRLTQSVFDEKSKTTVNETTTESTSSSTATSSTDSSAPASTSGSGVVITAPNSGNDLETSGTEFEILGSVPKETTRVEVNDYQLQKYVAGTTSFSYRAYASIGNLEIGQKNRYVVRAYDKDGTLLGSDEITISVQSGTSQAPVITLPVSSTSYTTTLETLVLGGTVGKWTNRVYVNGEELKEYIPGSESWRTTVSLQPGANTFTVKAERDGETVGSDTITIDLE
ncbi:FecR domain-containing protein [Candidatus Peregrinibacteria bacterium]|nr:MAG: FecR domain-containing protein [Candidatus Peregrinibacteria bacterium]